MDRNASSSGIGRGKIFLLSFLILVLFTLFGTFYPPDQNIKNEVEKAVEELKGSSFSTVALKIFQNNAIIATGMLIPLLGIGVSLYSMFSTGVAISSISYGIMNPQLAFLGVLLMPHGIIEYLAYSLLVSENVIFTYKIVARWKNLRSEVFTLLITLILAYMLLLTAGFIEAFFMSSLSTF